LTHAAAGPHYRDVDNRVAPEARGASVGRVLAGAARIAALAVAVAASTGFARAADTSAEPRLGDAEAPSFTLQDTAGQHVALDTFRGRLVVVNFFATWCEPCRDELPTLQRLVERGGDKGPAVIAISVAEPPQRVARFLEKMPLNFPVLLDETRTVTKSWEVEILPTTFVLDAQLRLRLIVKGDHNWDDVDLTTLPERLSASSRDDGSPRDKPTIANMQSGD
jgi:peroxiredoxin